MSIVDLATTEADDPPESAAVKRGRLDGLNGGRSRADKQTTEQRASIAQNAVIARWSKTD